MAGGRYPFPLPGPGPVGDDPMSALRGGSGLPRAPVGATPQEDPVVAGGNLGRGVGSGLHGTLASIQGYGAALADSMGFTDFANNQYQSALRRQQMAAAMAPTVQTTDQIHGFGDAANYAAGQIGTALGGFAPAVAAGVVGGTPGLVASMVPMAGGDVALRHRQAVEAGAPGAAETPAWQTLGAATAHGVANAALGVSPLMSVVGKGPLARGMTQMTKSMSPAEAFAARTAATAGLQGGQQGVQEATAQGTLNYLHGQPLDQLDPEAIKQATIAGAVGMAPFALGHGAAGGVHDAGGAAAALAKAGIGKGKELAGQAADSAPAQGVVQAGRNAFDRAKTVVEGVKQDYDTALAPMGEDANLGSKLEAGREAVANNLPAAGEAVKRTAHDIVNLTKDTFAPKKDTPAPDVYKALDALAGDHPIGDAKWAAADMPASAKNARAQMVSDALARLQKAKHQLTPEQNARVQAIIDGSPADTWNARGEIAGMYRNVLKKQVEKNSLDALTVPPLRGRKEMQSLSPTTERPKGLWAEDKWAPVLERLDQMLGTRVGAELPGKVGGDAPLTPAQVRGVQARNRPAPVEPAAKAREIPSGKPKEREVVAEGAVADKFASLFDEPGSPIVDQHARAYTHFVRSLLDNDAAAHGRLEDVVHALGELAEERGKPEAGVMLRRAVINAAQIGRMAAKTEVRMSPEAEKNLQNRVRMLEADLQFTTEPITKRIAKLGGMEPDEAAKFTSDYVNRRMALNKGYFTHYPVSKTLLDAIEAHNGGGEPIAEFAGQRIDPNSEQARSYIARLADRALRVEIEQRFGKKAGEAQNLLDAQVPDVEMGKSLVPTADEIQARRGDEYDASKVGPDHMSMVSGEAAAESLGMTGYDQGPPSRMLSELGAFSRHSNAWTDGKSELHHSREQLKTGDLNPGSESRFHHVTVQEAAMREASEGRRASMDAADPFAPEALAGVKSYEDILKGHIDKAMARSAESAAKSRAALESVGKDSPSGRAEPIDVDSLLAAAQRQSKSDGFKPMEFFKSRVDSEQDARHLNDLFWHEIRAKHYTEHGAEKHAEAFPYSVHTIEPKGELRAGFTDGRIEKAFTDKDGPTVIEVNRPDGSAAKLDLLQALHKALHDKEENFTPPKMREALGEFIDHVQHDSKLVDPREPFPKATREKLGLGGDMSPALETALGLRGEGRAAPELKMVASKGAPTERAGRDNGLIGGLKDAEGNRVQMDLPASIRELAAKRGAEKHVAEALDIENVAALAKEVLAVAREQFGDAFPKVKELADVPFYTNDKGRTFYGRDLKDYFSVREPIADLSAQGNSYRKTLAAFELAVQDVDNHGVKQAKGIDEMLARTNRMIANAERTGQSAEAARLRRDAQDLMKQKATLLSRVVDKKSMELRKQADSDEYHGNDVPGLTADQARALKSGRMPATPEQLGDMRFPVEGQAFPATLDTDTTTPLVDKIKARPAAPKDAPAANDLAAKVAKAESMYETLQRLGNGEDPIDRPGPTDIQYTEGLHSGEKPGPLETDPSGEKIRYARPGELKEKVAPLPKLAPEVEQIRAMLSDKEPTADILQSIKAYSPEGREAVKAFLGEQKGPQIGALKRGMEKFSLSDTVDRDPHAGRTEAIVAAIDRLNKVLPDKLFERATVNDRTDSAGVTIDPGTPDGKTRVEISVNAKDPNQAGYHESIHGLFKALRVSDSPEARKVMDTMVRATTELSEATKDKIKALLTEGLEEKRAEALRQAFDTDAEERAAYIYQLRAAGVIDRLNPATENVFKKFFNFLRRFVGIRTDAEKAETFLKSFESGEFAKNYDNPSAVLRAMGEETRVAKAYEATTAYLKPIAEAVANAFTPSYERLKKVNNSGLNKIADAYGRMSGDESGRLGIAHERKRMAAKWENELSPIVDGLSKAERDALVAEIQLGQVTSPKAKELQGAIDKIVGQSGHTPKIWDRQLIEERFTEFMTDLKNHGEITGPKEPGAIRKVLQGDESDKYTTGRELPSFKFKDPEYAKKWMKQDFESYVGGFIRQRAAKVTRDRAFGEDGAKLKAMFDEARTAGATEQELGLARNFIAGAEGWLGAHMDPNVRKLQSAVITGLNLVHLPFSILSAAVDPIYIGARSASVGEAWSAYVAGMSSIKDSLFNKDGKINSDGVKFGEDLGLIAQAGLADPMEDFFSSMTLEGANKKVNALFFRYNLLQGWERSMFGASAMAAERFLIRHSDGHGEHSLRYLKDLGLKPEDITTRPDGRLAIFEHDGVDAETSVRLQNAIYHFSHQAAARPTTMSNTIWMNDARFALIAHMKPFIMAQSAGVLKWLHEEREMHKNYAPLAIAALAVPMQLAMGQARNLITEGHSMAGDPLSAIAQSTAAAGLLGTYDFAFDVVNNAYHNLGLGIGIDALAGPAVEDVLALLKHKGK